MNLTKDDKNFYENLYSSLDRKRTLVNETACKQIIHKGIEDDKIVNQIWSLTSKKDNLEVLSKTDFFKMLKYIAAHQNGYDLSSVDI
mmetsp:Transcript_3331/g.2887  ORF Transcript_3331/g.2887 Transcript_3331/m.2887 type:complete len:87 (+) Transcript_3331:68-328(+)